MPTYVRPGQAAASIANAWPAEHMGGARAATRGPDSPWAMDAAQSALYGETSPGLPIEWWDPSPDRARVCYPRECSEPSQTPGVLASTGHIFLNVFFNPRPATPNTFFSLINVIALHGKPVSQAINRRLVENKPKNKARPLNFSWSLPLSREMGGRGLEGVEVL